MDYPITEAVIRDLLHFAKVEEVAAQRWEEAPPPEAQGGATRGAELTAQHRKHAAELRRRAQRLQGEISSEEEEADPSPPVSLGEALGELLAIPDDLRCWCTPGIGEVGDDGIARCHQCGNVMLASTIAEVLSQ